MVGFFVSIGVCQSSSGVTEYFEILLASQAKNRQCQVIHSLVIAHIAIWWPYRARGIVSSDKKVFDMLREHLYRVSSNLAKSSGGISGGILLTIAGIWYLIVFF